MTKNDEWWASLTIAQKEHIAYKVVKASLRENEERPVVTYPACTRIWNQLDEERKQQIHDHCTDAHGMVIIDWQEGQSLSY